MSGRQAVIDHARACFLRACWLDVAVRKPGNVSQTAPGHGMKASMFIASAQAAAGALFEPGARVGVRIEAAVAATWSAVGCNTNLGIVLLCAPIARAIEHCADAASALALQAAIESELAGLDAGDARAAYRAIVRANPGGLGSVPDGDVRQAPGIDLRAAMTLAAQRDAIARQYRDGFADLWALARLAPAAVMASNAPPDAAATAAVQRLYLACLSAFPDSHIVRKHGEGVAHTVMRAAQNWRRRAEADPALALDADPAFCAWDRSLKAARINPGTSADFTVAALWLSGCLGARGAAARESKGRWHES
ncbi:MAG: triphosphoribosyl-dephospho-CoA synthase [Desulfovibrionaceae bacterium]|jgi:triphosphoribosyl-dephospho-CoA synthase|nr:triphosphoribosyl-dephospho-CoA synthase [Desulfovibrionaceae bacterium]